MKLFSANEIRQIMPSNYELHRKLCNTIFNLNSELKYAAQDNKKEITFLVDIDVAARIKELLFENGYQFYYVGSEREWLKIWIKW